MERLRIYSRSKITSKKNICDHFPFVEVAGAPKIKNMVRKPRVSIGMPVYNGERFLKDAIDSLLAQRFEDFELIILDNASTDRTEEICRTYADQDNRIRYVRNEENIGLARNFNRAFQLSSGEYFKWASADDVCHRDLVASCLG